MASPDRKIIILSLVNGLVIGGLGAGALWYQSYLWEKSQKDTLHTASTELYDIATKFEGTIYVRQTQVEDLSGRVSGIGTRVFGIETQMVPKQTPPPTGTPTPQG